MTEAELTRRALLELVQGVYPHYLRALGRFIEYQKTLRAHGFYQIIEENFYRYQKIGVFGAFRPQNARVIIEEISRHIAARNCVVFTGKGYYHPATPNVYQSLSSIMPQEIQNILNDLTNDQYFFSHVLPSIIDKAVSRVIPIRTNYLELLGCDRDKYNKPVLGFADNPNILNMKREKCNWTNILSRTTDTLMCCEVNHPLSCPIDHKRDVNCIFYYPHNSPQIIKTQFLYNEWDFYSLTNYRAIYPYINEFIKT